MNQAKIQPTQMQATALQLYAETNLPTEFGTFRVMVFREAETEAEHMAIIKGDITASRDLPIRIHSECFTGEVLHSQKCDCREQLHAALEYISNQEAGMIIYLRQEGRGIGLGNKIRAYALQESGHDTVEANRLLGFGDDLRTYEVAAEILFHFKIGAVSLLTNNPLKIQALQNHGVQVNKRLPLICPTNQHSLSYFKTKQERMGHMFDVNADSKDQTDNGTVVATFPESSTK